MYSMYVSMYICVGPPYRNMSHIGIAALKLLRSGMSHTRTAVLKPPRSGKFLNGAVPNWGSEPGIYFVSYFI
jgi:hypothetical protein